MKLSSLISQMMVLLCVGAGVLIAAEPAKPADEHPVRTLAREASSSRRKAADYRVLSLNALKNADAEREEAHKALVAAMTSGKGEAIGKAKDALDNAADELSDVIGQVERAIEYSMKAEMAAKKAEEMCKLPASKEDEKEKADLDEIRGLLGSAAKQLAKAEEISKKLRKEWLVPFFASTTTTSSTTTTTKAAPTPKAP